MNRIVSFEYIRAIAIIAIVICHCCYGIGNLGFLGIFLGLTFNVIFLVLSAFLIGLSWEKKGNPQYDVSFLKTRIVKLTYSYYPFIIGMFIFLFFAGYRATIKDYITHVTFLPWFDKLSGFGHLWFITMIVICYFAIYTISKLPRNMLNLIKNGGGILLLIGLISPFGMEKAGLPSRMVLYLMLYICAFLNAKTILEFFNKIPIRILYTFVIAIAGTIALFYFKLTNTYIETYCCLICATIIFALLVRLFSNADNNKIIAYISSISFEIYLVHHAFCFGKYSLYKIIPNPFLGTIAIFITSFVLAYLLKQISSCIKNITSE